MITTLLSLFGGGLGGILRFVPEIIKLFQAKYDQAHEFKMTELQLKIDDARSKQQLDLIGAQSQATQAATEAQAYLEAIKGQAAPTGVKWVDALSASVRPVVTYWYFTIYTAYKTCLIIVAWQTSANLADFAVKLWTENDWVMLSTILGFWFVDRAIRKNTNK